MTEVLIEEITEKQYIQIKLYLFRKIIINILGNSFLYKYIYMLKPAAIHTQIIFSNYCSQCFVLKLQCREIYDILTF